MASLAQASLSIRTLCIRSLRYSTTITAIACIQRLRIPMTFQCATRNHVRTQYHPFATATSGAVVNKKALRGVASLKREHFRMKTTLMSFARMLDQMKNESHLTNTVSKQHLVDLDNFLKFCRSYSLIHMNKEELMYERARNSNYHEGNCSLLNKMRGHHTHCAELYHLMERSAQQMEKAEKQQDKVNSLDDVFIPSKSFILLLHSHIDEEDDVIYPALLEKFNEQEMEEISQQFDSLNNENHECINAMEFLSDELNRKYHWHS